MDFYVAGLPKIPVIEVPENFTLPTVEKEIEKKPEVVERFHSKIESIP